MLGAFRAALGASACKRGCLAAGARPLNDSDCARGLSYAGTFETYRVRRSVRCVRAKAVDSSRMGEDGIVKGAHVLWKDPAMLQLRRRAYIVWQDDAPQRCLIVKKPKSEEASAAMREIGLWLSARGIGVYVENSVLGSMPASFEAFEPGGVEIDFCVTLGGDGTVLHLASLFAEDEPLAPVVSFAMGTLGFLTPFDIRDFEKQLTRILVAGQQTVGCTLRSRKRCEVYTGRGRRLSVHHTLNECIIDRGASASTLTVDLFVDGQYVTTVTADGLIAATPSGSTAYSMTAGGPMVAPSVPCTIITPVAPLSLSFRPLVVPETSDIVILIAEDSKSMGRASFDGRHQTRLVRGSSVRLTTSLCPLPLITVGELDADWYEGITQKLKWNQSIIDQPKRPRIPKGVGAIKGRESSNGSGPEASDLAKASEKTSETTSENDV
ncbi:unnamed protein product [Ostreobium quekettii]|uniref:Uncharacterized protein n=1 Tax=Ostreobium quekettii TaxID=121088 RepID=A0A8S1J247_9CHLO|nr:unnamed protein product [Ostreobium quekettii]|eukprot:evm.model.scf_845.8 EVM.evm.TU.scf_845.8   scf_845:58261-59574(+)